MKDFLNLPGNENVKNLASKGTKKNEGENTKDIIKIENGKIYLDGVAYDLSDCKTWNRDFLLELNNKKLNKSNKTIEVQGQFSLEFTSDKKVQIRYL